MPRTPKEKEKKSKYHHDFKPTRVDLTRDDCYELCYDVVEDTRVFTGKLNERLLVERYSPTSEDKREFDSCIVSEISESGSLIKLWDEVREQTYYVDISQPNIPLILRILKSIKTKRIVQQIQPEIDDVEQIPDEDQNQTIEQKDLYEINVNVLEL